MSTKRRRDYANDLCCFKIQNIFCSSKKLHWFVSKPWKKFSLEDKLFVFISLTKNKIKWSRKTKQNHRLSAIVTRRLYVWSRKSYSWTTRKKEDENFHWSERKKLSREVDKVTFFVSWMNKQNVTKKDSFFEGSQKLSCNFVQ